MALRKNEGNADKKRIKKTSASKSEPINKEENKTPLNKQKTENEAEKITKPEKSPTNSSPATGAIRKVAKAGNLKPKASETKAETQSTLTENEPKTGEKPDAITTDSNISAPSAEAETPGEKKAAGLKSKRQKKVDSPTKSITPKREIKKGEDPVAPKKASAKPGEEKQSAVKSLDPKKEIAKGEDPVSVDSKDGKRKSDPSEKATKKTTGGRAKPQSAGPETDKSASETPPAENKKTGAKKRSPKRSSDAMPAETFDKTAEAATVSKPADAKKEPKTSASSSKKAMPSQVRIRFIIRFHTNPGQSIFISGDHEIFGQKDLSMALPLQYVDQDRWSIELDIDPALLPKEGFSYNYVLRDQDGSLTLDWGRDKVLSPDDLTAAEVVFIDSWNYAGYIDNIFYTEPFRNVLLNQHFEGNEIAVEEAYTHLFRVKSPLLKNGQTLCISGNWNDWDQNRPVLMRKAPGKDYFEVGVDLSAVAGSVVYKYGIFDTVAQKFERFEEGENRILNPPTPSVKTIINDGFALLPSTLWRGAGVTVPVFSLRSAKSEGIGDFHDIRLLADWAKKTGLKLIQLLPVNDTTITFSWQDSYPYATISSFALHPVYLRLSEMVSEENRSVLEPYLIEFESLNKLPSLDYESVLKTKWEVIRKIYPLQKDQVFESEDYKTFFEKNKDWLIPYAAFCYYRDQYKTADFNHWPAHSVYHATEATHLLAEGSDSFEEAAIHLFVQFHLHNQLKDAANYAHQNGVILKGDIPIGISRNGADAWQHPDLFNMNLQAGAPPDDFAKTGQNWGFPTYNWDVMQRNGFHWWRSRFDQMSNYFDSFRIDHILGFFRMWSIPFESVEGIMGHFEPAIPVYLKEFYERNIRFDRNRYCLPFINHQTLTDIFGDQTVHVKNQFLDYKGNDHYEFKEAFNTQRKLVDQFANWEQNEHNSWLKYQLMQLLGNVILFEAEGSNGQEFHFRFDMDKTTSFQWLDEHTKGGLKDLYVNYYFQRQNDFWLHQAMQKLPPLKRETDMMVCGEDLGLVPDCVPSLMLQLGILSLEIQRMPKKPGREFFDPADAPYLSVVMPSTHDMSTVRGWWEEDRNKTQRFFNEVLHHRGYPPYYCDAWVNKAIVMQHLQSPAIWSIFQIQDLFGINRNIRRLNPHEERINDPAVSKYYWNYRIHLTLEKLLDADEFNHELKESVQVAGRS